DLRSGGVLDLESARRASAVQLFAERAKAACPDFDVTSDNLVAVIGICRRLDGLPLALELAAPWIGLLGPETLYEELQHRLSLLVAGPQDLPQRQRSLRAALAWSCDLLTSEERTLLRRLSVFAGSATLEAIEFVGGTPGPPAGTTLQLLQTLADHSL